MSNLVQNNLFDVNPTELKQTSLFDYSGFTPELLHRSIERKARIKANEQVAIKAFYDIAQDVKAQHDDMGNYDQWLDWCQKELGYKKVMACNLLKIGKELVHHGELDFLPKSYKGLLAIAEGLSKADSEETKEEILEQVQEATEGKGTALTEKEIKELPVVKELQEAKAKAEQEAREAKEAQKKAQMSLELKETELVTKTKEIANRFLDLKAHLKDPNFRYEHSEEELSNLFDLPIDMVREAIIATKAEDSVETVKKSMELTTEQLAITQKQLVEKEQTIANQNNQIQELSYKLSEFENQLKDIDEKSTDLVIQEQNLQQIIAEGVDEKLKEKLQEEQKLLEKKQQELEQEKAKIKHQQKELKDLIHNAQGKLANIRSISNWVNEIDHLIGVLRTAKFSLRTDLDNFDSMLDSLGKIGISEEDKAKILVKLGILEKEHELMKEIMQNIDSNVNKITQALSSTPSVDVEAVEVDVIDEEKETDSIPF